ncbi:883_t:CDS:2, partial [Dentiscutata erythropus]
ALIQGSLPSHETDVGASVTPLGLSDVKGSLQIQHRTHWGTGDLLGCDEVLDPQPDHKKAKDWEEKRSRRQIHIHQGNVGNVIGNIDGTINARTFVATSKRGSNREKNKDEVTKRSKIESQDLPIEADSEESIKDEPKDKYNTPPPLF